VTVTFDAGLQAERTILAYGRTQLVSVVVALLVVRDDHAGARHTVAVALAVGAVALVCVAAALRQRRLRLSALDAGSPGRTTASITVAVTLLQAMALVIVL
jgi:uncharacterized membrane protein YidH (DUF202 family)